MAGHLCWLPMCADCPGCSHQHYRPSGRRQFLCGIALGQLGYLGRPIAGGTRGRNPRSRPATQRPSARVAGTALGRSHSGDHGARYPARPAACLALATPGAVVNAPGWWRHLCAWRKWRRRAAGKHYHNGDYHGDFDTAQWLELR